MLLLWAMHLLKKKIEFAASHKLWNHNWSQEKNFEVYGKCANPNGHGHNYTVEITLRGEPDQETGMMINFRDVKNVLQKEIYDRVDHKNLNMDVPELHNVNPTAENLSVVFWKLLNPHFQGNARLAEVTVKEKDHNIITYTEV